MIKKTSMITCVYIIEGVFNVYVSEKCLFKTACSRDSSDSELGLMSIGVFKFSRDTSSLPVGCDYRRESTIFADKSNDGNLRKI
jgi:hypothetical protein